MQASETPYDLRWRMFGIPIRVHPMFWVMTLLLSGSALERGFEYVLLWVGCVFVSILVHEMGHVLMGRRFGAEGRIILYGFGGVAINSNRLARRPQRVAVAFAGPLAGFVFLAAILAVVWGRNPEAFRVYLAVLKTFLGIPVVADPGFREQFVNLSREHRLEFEAVRNLIFINLLWGLLNLLPIWPLDGGQISREICEGVSPRKGMEIALMISIGVAGLFTVHSILAMNGRPLLPIAVGSMFSAIFFGLFALESYQLLQQVRSADRRRDEWERRGRF